MRTKKFVKKTVKATAGVSILGASVVVEKAAKKAINKIKGDHEGASTPAVGKAAARHALEVDDEGAKALHARFENLRGSSVTGMVDCSGTYYEQMYRRMAVRVGEDGVITEEELADAFTFDDVSETGVEEEYVPELYL